MNKRQIFSIFLIVVLVISSLPLQNIFAAELTEQQFMAMLADMGIQPNNSAGLKANVTTYNRYNLIVYGSPYGEPGRMSDVTHRIEYRYLGYTVDNKPYTNSFYPADPLSDNTTPPQWKFLDIGASSTWTSPDVDSDVKAFMQAAQLKYDGTAYTNLKVGTTTQPNETVLGPGGLGLNRAKRLDKASFKNGFSVYTKFKNLYGATRYATFYGPSMGEGGLIDLEGLISTPSNTYYIRASEDSVTVPVTVTANAKLLNPYAKAKHIEKIDAEFEGMSNPKSAVTTTNVTKNKIYTRNEYPAGTYSITLDGTATMKSILSSDDLYVKKPQKTITLIVEPAGPSPYAAATIDAEDSKQFTGTDIPVKVNMTATLNNLADSSKISEVIFHMRKLPAGADDQYQRINMPAALVSNISYTFTVPAFKLSGVDSYTQEFEGRVQYVLKDGTSIWGPTVNVPAEKDSTYIYKLKPPIDTNIPPVPIITGDDTAVVGSSVFISGAKSYDPDGTIAGYSWYFRDPDLERPNKLEDEGTASGSVTYKFTGRKQIILGVTDNKGAYSETEHFIEVTPPYPIPIMTQLGTLKVNRKITIDASPSYSPPSYPIDHSKTTWTITPVTAGITAADIKYTGSLTGVTKDFLVKKAGKYKVTLSVTNTANMTSTTEQILDIVPDIAPVANFTVVKEQLRNPSNYTKAQVILYDKSYSEDGDYIGKRIWKYAYDSDNDGLFTDETWKVLDSGNNTQPELYVSDVGKYAFELEVEEAYGQPTIPELILLSDILKANTSEIPLANKMTEVINLAPVADISGRKMKNIDLVVLTDYTGTNSNTLQTKLNQYISDSLNKNLNVKLSFLNGQKYLGRYMPEDAGQFDLVQNETTPKYAIANWNGLTEWSDNTYHVIHTTKHLYTNFSTETYGTFPSYIKKSVSYGEARIWLLENGDVYFLGTNSTNNYGWWSSQNIYALRPIKILSNVKQLVGGDTIYYMLTTSGDVYAIGHTFSTYFQPQNYYFQSYNNMNLGASILLQNDNDGTNPYNSNFSNTFTGYYSAAKVNGLSSIEYIWSSGSALVARKSDGKWYGLGRGLNAFGLSTGFENTPPSKVGEYSTNSYKHYLKGIDDQYYCDNVNTVREIPNLSALDRTLGGIAKVAPNTVYTKNGDMYSVKETPVTLYGYEEFNSAADVPKDGRIYTGEPYWGKYRVEYPFQVLRSNFTYSKTGTWTKERTQYNTYAYEPAPTVTQIMASGVPIDPYLDLLGIPRTGVKEMYNSRGSTPQVIQPTSFLSKSNRITYSGITDYSAVAYIEDYTFSYKVYDATLHYTNSRDEDLYGGYRFFYTYTVRPIVIPMELRNQAGRKTYGVETKDLSSITFRPDSQKYVLYLGENDSFQNISKDLISYIVDNKVNVKVSAKSAYIDEPVDTTKYINLRQFATATPTGTIYGEYAIDQMLQDITNENADITTKDNKIYVIVNEDTVDYQKYYFDYENDIRNAERYKYDHDPNYFENSLGLASYSGQWLNDLQYKFDKVGKYLLTYQAQDNPKNNPLFTNYWLWSNGTNQLEIYVHRRPIADFIAIANETFPTYKTLIFKDRAYDIDHRSQTNKGIVQTEWKWKLQTETTWRNGLPLTIEAGKPIYIWQRVLDEEGAWSYPTIKLLTYEEIKSPPEAQFTITKNPIKSDELLQLKDTSFARQGSLTKWHWVVEKLSNHTIVQNTQFTTHNAGTGALAGYDSNVKTNYDTLGPGSYKIYLRVKDSNNLWSDLGTDTEYDLNYFYSQTLIVEEACKLSDFRVTMVRDLHLESYYKNVNGSNPLYIEKPFYPSSLALDVNTFNGGAFPTVVGFDGFTKGYKFEFAIDSTGFNDAGDTITFVPAFYAYYPGVPATRGSQIDLYWENSKHEVLKVGEGGHAPWKLITLNSTNRSIIGSNAATWRGSYLIPGSAFAVPLGTSVADAESMLRNGTFLKADIIVNFKIKGYKSGVMKYDYNSQGWPVEAPIRKAPYEIGDVITYDWDKSNLDDVQSYRKW